MRTRTPKASSRALPCLFGLWVAGLCVVCIGFAGRSDGWFSSHAEAHASTPARSDALSLTHAQFADDASVLMSCAEEPSSNNEPLWCAHPDSPHCTRGTPAPSSAESWLGPVFASTSAALALPTLMNARTASAPSPAALLGHAQTEAERLERPPRRA